MNKLNEVLKGEYKYDTKKVLTAIIEDNKIRIDECANARLERLDAGTDILTGRIRELIGLNEELQEAMEMLK